MSTHGQCDKLPNAILASELNSDGVSTFGKIFTGIILKENMACRCPESEAPISCYTKGVSFRIKVSIIGFESLSP
jgi:hypothetical protein